MEMISDKNNNLDKLYYNEFSLRKTEMPCLSFNTVFQHLLGMRNEKRTVKDLSFFDVVNDPERSDI